MTRHRTELARLDHLDIVDLLCDRELQPFYARPGMERAVAMGTRRCEKQAGAS